MPKWEEAPTAGAWADAPLADAAPEQSWLSGLTTEAASGATLGVADYTTAGLHALAVHPIQAAISGEDYDPVKAFVERFKLIREQRRKFQEENPVSSTAAQVAGGAAVAPNVVGGVASAVRAALPAATPRAVATGAGLAAGGAVEGGVVGGLEAEPGQNVEGAAVGATMGAGLGTALPAFANLTGRAARRFLQSLAQNQPVTAAERKILERMKADDMTPRQVMARLKKLGPNATIADAAGENVRGLAEDLANQPGRTRNMAQRILGRRQLGQSARLTREAQEGLGAEGDFYGRIDALSRQRSADARPLYEEAFAMQPFRRERLTRFVQDPIIQRGINRGLEIQRLEALADDVPFNPMDYAVKGFDKEGNAILGDVPNLRLMDAAKRGLDDIINDARNETTGRIQWTERLRAVDRVRRALLGELDELTGGAEGPYARARAMWAGPSQSMDAMHMGRRFMRGDHEVTARIVDGMDEGQREFFREGVFQELQHRLGGTSETRNQTLKFLRTPNVREALHAVFPDERSYRRFMAQALRENRFSETRNIVSANSATARRLAGQEDMGIDPGVAVDVATGAYGHAAVSIIRKALNSLKNMPQAQKNRIGDMLFSQDTEAQRKALLALQNRYQRGQLGQQQWEVIRNLIAGEGALVGAETALPGQ